MSQPSHISSSLIRTSQVDIQPRIFIGHHWERQRFQGKALEPHFLYYLQLVAEESRLTAATTSEQVTALRHLIYLYIAHLSEPTFSQNWIAGGEHLCLCRAYRHCGKQVSSSSSGKLTLYTTGNASCTRVPLLLWDGSRWPPFHSTILSLRRRLVDNPPPGEMLSRGGRSARLRRGSNRVPLVCLSLLRESGIFCTRIIDHRISRILRAMHSPEPIH